jgi:diguanylate cyclase (GGDEF)-like protein
MPSTWLDQLPAAHARLIKTATVEPYLSTMLAHLPEQLLLDAALPADPEAIPLAARQLVKLSLGGTKLVPRALSRSQDGSTRLTVSFGEGRCVLGPEILGQGLAAAVQHTLQSLFSQADFIRLLDVFAFQSSNLATLQKVVNHMLRSTDVDKALYAMLSGITSGQGLGFNRAVLFIHDEKRDCYVGSKAIGPADAGEAHRIWEAIAYEDMSIDRLIEDYDSRKFESCFEKVVQGIEVAAGEDDADEIKRAESDGHSLVFGGTPLRNAGLARLGVASQFVLAAINPHGKKLGLIYADNLYSRTPITAEQLKYFSFFIDQTALVWENLSLLRRVELLARYDGLTGVYNRREFEARFQDEKSRAVRSRSSCSLIIMDIDLFKEVNDRLGHQAGDDMLRRMGAVLRDSLRTHDILGRFGGDEFVVLLPATSKEQLAQAARRILQKAREANISLSLGGANWPSDCDDPKLLLTAADANLYRAKRQGRGRGFLGVDDVVVATDELAVAQA